MINSEFRKKMNRKNRHFFDKFFRFPKSVSCRCPLNPQKKHAELTLDELSYAYGNVSNGRIFLKFRPNFKTTKILNDCKQFSQNFPKKLLYGEIFFLNVRCVSNLRTWQPPRVAEGHFFICQMDPPVRIFSKNESKIFDFFEKSISNFDFTNL